MRLKAVLFDLDGTLLPMDQEEFTRGYFRLLAKRLAPAGYDPKGLVDAVWAGTAAMVKNDGSRSNEEAFWDRFAGICGEKSRKDIPLFDEFYRTDFQGARECCGFSPLASQAVGVCRKLGLRTALATNPIFPAVATESRIRWAGLEPSDFELITTYENIGFCKPNPAYYTEIAKRMDLSPGDCLMVGNDATEDLAAEAAGMEVFLLTDCLINKEEKDVTLWPHGSFEELIAFLERLQQR